MEKGGLPWDAAEGEEVESWALIFESLRNLTDTSLRGQSRLRLPLFHLLSSSSSR